jgi:hypothetical protein
MQREKGKRFISLRRRVSRKRKVVVSPQMRRELNELWRISQLIEGCIVRLYVDIARLLGKLESLQE